MRRDIATYVNENQKHLFEVGSSTLGRITEGRYICHGDIVLNMPRWAEMFSVNLLVRLMDRKGGKLEEEPARILGLEKGTSAICFSCVIPFSYEGEEEEAACAVLTRTMEVCTSSRFTDIDPLMLRQML